MVIVLITFPLSHQCLQVTWFSFFFFLGYFKSLRIQESELPIWKTHLSRAFNHEHHDNTPDHPPPELPEQPVNPPTLHHLSFTCAQLGAREIRNNVTKKYWKTWPEIRRMEVRWVVLSSQSSKLPTSGLPPKPWIWERMGAFLAFHSFSEHENRKLWTSLCLNGEKKQQKKKKNDFFNSSFPGRLIIPLHSLSGLKMIFCRFWGRQTENLSRISFLHDSPLSGKLAPISEAPADVDQWWITQCRVCENAADVPHTDVASPRL